MTRAELGELIETVKKRRDELGKITFTDDMPYFSRMGELNWFLSLLEKYYEKELRESVWKPKEFADPSGCQWPKNKRRGAREIWDLI